MINLKNKSLYYFCDTYFGKDSNKMSIFDRVIGVIKRHRKKTSFVEDIVVEAEKEIMSMEEFSMTVEELNLAIYAALIYTQE